MTKNKLLANEYYICLKGSNNPIYWDLSDSESKIDIDCSLTYFSKVFEAMEKSLQVKGLVFYLTWENLDRLPSYGDKVVAILLGDEWCRIPKYSHQVRAVFKCYGIRPTLGCNPLSKPSYLNLMTLVNFIKLWIVGLPGQLSYTLKNLRNRGANATKIAPIYDIPLGYYQQLDLPLKAIEDRLYDVSFAGSIEHKLYSIWSWKYWFKSPKIISRKEMLCAIDLIRKNNPEIKFDLTVTSDFNAARSADKRSYSAKMMDTKISLVPRGTSLETYRFFEAIRYGCIVVTEALPSRWFYDRSPAIQITDWKELGDLIDKLVNNQQLMKKKHQESLDWWKTKCSEVAVGNYIAEKLN
ncbi:MAG: hypothetical protein QNJ72_11915 [Pleurocapsa sp. MO_226.B13]|nr:hypothetical protein [Pleurocapsa sp. MO_226.B13]